MTVTDGPVRRSTRRTAAKEAICSIRVWPCVAGVDRARVRAVRAARGWRGGAPARPNMLVILATTRLLEHQPLQPRRDGYATPNIDRIGREGVMFTDHYAAAELHRGPRRIHHRPVADPHRHDDRGPARLALGIEAGDPTLAEVLKQLGYRPGSSARTTSATATSTCPPCTASTSSTATSTT